MTVNGSITNWIDRLKAGESAAPQALWEVYYRRMIRLARDQLRGHRLAAAGEDDVVLLAFHSLCQGVEKGRFPKLEDRDDLWQVLLMLTARKAINLVRDENRQKRGGNKRRQLDPAEFAEYLGREPTPEMAARLAEDYARLLGKLGDPVLQTVALRKSEGYSNAEIAQQLECSVPTVERRLRLIRKTWEQELDA
jgi:RNA polymerase sigma factor (sigma-70 family)